MENIYSFKYFKELNQKSLIEESSIEKKFPSLEEMIEVFYEYVEKVTPKEELAVQMGICFTNNLMYAIHVMSRKYIKHHFNFMFWPIYGEINYEFKKGNFFVNQGREPVEISDSAGLSGEAHHKFFFSRNPFRNKEFYRDKFYNLLPDLYDELKEDPDWRLSRALMKGVSYRKAIEEKFSLS